MHPLQILHFLLWSEVRLLLMDNDSRVRHDSSICLLLIILRFPYSKSLLLSLRLGHNLRVNRSTTVLLLLSNLKLHLTTSVRILVLEGLLARELFLHLAASWRGLAGLLHGCFVFLIMIIVALIVIRFMV